MTVQEQFVMVEHRRRAQPGAARPLRRFSVDEYHWLIEHGFFGSEDRVELLDGYLVQMRPIRPPHAYCAGQLYQAFVLQLGGQAVVRSQQPITLPQQTSEPEPDLLLALPPAAAYSTRQPGSAGRQAGYQEHMTLDVDGSLAPVAFPECRIDFSQVFP